VPTLFIDVKPAEAAEVATIHVDSVELVGTKLELDTPRRVHVSVTAIGFQRFAEVVDVQRDMTFDVMLEPRPHKKKSRTLAVTLGMGAIGLVAWLVRRR
jgi:hypothetical protein